MCMWIDPPHSWVQWWRRPEALRERQRRWPGSGLGRDPPDGCARPPRPCGLPPQWCRSPNLPSRRRSPRWLDQGQLPTVQSPWSSITLSFSLTFPGAWNRWLLGRLVSYRSRMPALRTAAFSRMAAPRSPATQTDSSRPELGLLSALWTSGALRCGWRPPDATSSQVCALALGEPWPTFLP